MAITNDWLVANVNNPNLDVYDLTTLGDINTDNTQFMRKEDYLNSKFIKENDLFKDESGNFSQIKFDSFYNAQAQRWHQIQEDSYPKGLQLDYFSTRRKPNSRVRETKFDIGPEYDPANGKMGNPNQVKMGISGWNNVDERTKSEQEIAQSQKIFDPKTNKFLDYSPEDSSLFNSPVNFFKNILFDDSLVLATYDEDEVDQYGIQHHKGERKLNDQGFYYYEKLNGRSPLNKDILSIGNILTKEDSVLNHIDFFDSDDLEKSAAGIIAKNIAFIAPMFTPAAPYYYTALIAKEMSRALPMLYEVGTNLFGKESSAPEWVNLLASKGEQFTSGSSVYSSENMISFENFANLLTDVALQWGQQKRIAELVQRAGGKPKLLDEARARAKALYDSKAGGKLAGLAKVDESLVQLGAKAEDLWQTTTLGKLCLQKAYEPVVEAMRAKAQFGADLALIYMAIVSNTDVYADMKAKGATNKEAAWVTLASTAGMFSVDKYLHIGETFFEGLSDESLLAARNIAKKEWAEASSSIYGKNNPATLWTKGGALGKRIGEKLGSYWEKLKTHDFGSTAWQEGFAKAMTEGIEEVSEELVTDMSKGMYSILGDLGLYEKSVENPIDWDTALERYGMSFFGGAAGGALFYGVELAQNGFNPKEDADMADFIRKGKADALRKEVLSIRDKGKAGSNTLSGLDYVKDDKDNVTWLSTDQINRSQNYIIAERIIDKINAIEATIVGNNADLDDDDLFDHMVLTDLRYQQYKNAGKATGYYKEYRNRLNDLIKAESDLKRANLTVDGNPDGEVIKTDQQDRHNPNEELKQQRIAKLQERVDEAKKALDDFLSGDTSLEYTRKLNFILDPQLHQVFLGLDFREFLKTKLGHDVDPENIDPKEMLDIQNEWFKHYQEVLNSDAVDKGFKAYLATEKSILPALQEQEEISKVYEDTLNKLQELHELNEDETAYKYEFKNFLQSTGLQLYNLNSRLPDETDEQYEHRLDQSTLEARDTYIKRFQRIIDLNREIQQKYVDQLNQVLEQVGYQVDSATARVIVQNMRSRMKEIIAVEKGYTKIIKGSFFDASPYYDIMQDLDSNLSNAEEVKQKLFIRHQAQVQSQITNAVDKIQQFLQGLGNIKVTHEFVNQYDKMLDATGMAVLQQNLVSFEQLVLNSTINDDAATFLANIKANLNDDSLFDYITRRLGTVQEDETGESVVTYDLPLEDIKNTILKRLQRLNKEVIVDGGVQEESLFDIYQEFIEGYISDSNTSIEEGDTSEPYTIANLVEDLQNPESPYYKQLAAKSGNIPGYILQALLTAYGNGEVQQFVFGNDSSINVLTGNVYTPDFEDTKKTVSLQRSAVEEYLKQTIKRIETNPLYQLKNKLQTTIKSPLEKILENILIQIIPEDKVINVNQLLDDIYKIYLGVDNINEFQLESAQESDIENVITALKMLECYLYACTTSPNGEHFFGQHSQINSWAEQHSADLIKKWEPLPQFDVRYATLLDQERIKLLVEAQVWQRISAKNAMNKTYRLTMTEERVTKLHYEALKNISLKFTVDDKEYDVKEGIDFKDNLGEEQSENMVTLFDAEQGLYNNFQKILKESGLSVSEVIQRGQLFASTIKSGRAIRTQQVSELSPDLKALTDYDKILYILSILTDNPSDFYEQSITEAEDPQSKIAPITVQQNNSRLGEAAASAQFREAFELLADTYHIPQTKTCNTVHIDGVSGAGKTEVVLKYIKKRFKTTDENILIVGPTDSQSLKLARSLGASLIFNFDETSETNIFKKLLGDQWKEVQAEIQDNFSKMAKEYNLHIQPKDNYIGETKITGKFFDIVYYATPEGQYGIRIELHEDEFNFVDAYKQQYIFIDEAAYLNPAQIAILNLFTKKRNGVLYLANDSNQGGYQYNNNLIENLGPTSIFAIRTAKMQESLRSSNIQMQQNNKKLNTLLNQVNSVFDYGSQEQQEDMINRLPELVKKLNFRVYNGDDDINGYLFGAKTSDFIPKLVKLQNQAKAQGKVLSIGFIGKETSPTFYAMKAAGIEVQDPLSASPEPGRKFMQGQEFDYVVIDPIENLPTNLPAKYSLVSHFIKPFNTLATRGKNAAIFLDDFNGLFAPQQQDSRKSEGFSIASQVERFKQEYLKSVSAIKGKLTPTKSNEDATKKSEVKKEPEKSEEKIVTPVEYQPHTAVKDLIQKEEEYSLDEEEDDDEILSEFSASTGLFAEANLVMPVINLDKEDKNDKSSTWKPFDEASATNSVRRNLQAFVTTTNNSTKNGLRTYAEKAKYQEILSAIQSFILYGGSIDTLVNKFPQLKGFDFEHGKLCLELRKVEENDYYGVSASTIEKKNPDGSYTKVPIKDTFINGQYKFAIVYKVDAVLAGATRGSFKRIQAVFDICQMTDPKELISKRKQKEIITNATNRINKAQAKLDKAIAQGKNALVLALQKNIQRDNSLIANLEESAKKYNLLFDELVKKVENGEEAVIDLDSEDYVTHGVSRLVHRHSVRRLGEHISIENIELNKRYTEGPRKGEYITDLDSFMDQDLRKVISPVYLLGKQSDELKGIVDESVFGKAVIFVSNNTLLDRNELAERYIQQKLDPEHHTPEVRMIVLDNHGLSFSEIVYNRIQKTINGSTGSHSRKPYRMDVLGIRMFAAMWNFRAGLKAFNDAYDTWVRNSGYDETRVQNILLTEALLYQLNKGKTLQEQIDSGKGVSNFTKLLQDSIKNGGITQLLERLQNSIGGIKEITPEIKTFITNGINDGTLVKDLENLIKFNQVICKDIPIFRLGCDLTRKHEGGYVRQFSVSNSSQYGNGEYNLLAISSEAAKQFNFVLDSILNQLVTGDPITSKFTSYKALGVKLLKANGSELSATEFIGNKELSKNMSGLIHTNDKVIKVDGYEIPDKQLFSFFPSAVADIVKGFYSYATSPSEERGNGDLNIRNIDVNDNEVNFYFNLRSLKQNSTQPYGLKENQASRLLWMFDFIFHGTTRNLESWHNLKTGSEKKLNMGYLYDAPFKFGFFIDPETNYVAKDKILEVNINPQGDTSKFTLLEIGTHPAYFDVDVDSIPGGMAINIDKVLNKLRGVVKKVETAGETGGSGASDEDIKELTFETITQGQDFATEGLREFFEANKDKYAEDDYEVLFSDYRDFVINRITKILQNQLFNRTSDEEKFINKHIKLFDSSVKNISFDEDNDIINLTLESGAVIKLFIENDKLNSSMSNIEDENFEEVVIETPTDEELASLITASNFPDQTINSKQLLNDVKAGTGSDLLSWIANCKELDSILRDPNLAQALNKLMQFKNACNI